MKTGILIWVLVWNVIAFALMGMDKMKAKRESRRIRERTLFLPAALGGSVGAMMGMSLFRHKTLHWSFRLGMPAILLVQVAVLLGVSWWSTFVR